MIALSLSSIVNDSTEEESYSVDICQPEVMLQCLVISRAFGIAFGLSDPVSSGPSTICSLGLRAVGPYRAGVVLTCL